MGGKLFTLIIHTTQRSLWTQVFFSKVEISLYLFSWCVR